MQVRFYSGFHKRLNSTLQPAAALTPTVLTGYLKEPCSILNPVISFQTLTGAPAGLSYAYIAAFERYYFVKDWTWNDGLWTASLEVDVLATYRTQIGDMYAYVERAASEYDGSLIDKLYPTSSYCTTSHQLLQVPWNAYDEENGTYVVGIIRQFGSDAVTCAGGVVTYYAMTHAQLKGLVNYLLSPAFYIAAGFDSATADINLDLAKAIVKPLDYIVSCMWFPCAPSVFHLSATDPVRVGTWYDLDTGVSAPYITDRVAYVQQYETPLPTHPQAATRGKYLNKAPYTTFNCVLPPFGSFPIDTSYFNDVNSSIHFDCKIDAITGKATLLVGSLNPNDALARSQVFYETSAQFGVPIQLTQVSSDMIKTGVALAHMGVTGATAAVTGGLSLVLGGADKLIDNVGDALQGMMPQVYSEGANGSFLAFDLTTGVLATLTGRYYAVVDGDNAEIGRPLCKIRQLSALNGYIKCGEATVNIAAYDPEIDKVHKFLLTGFYRE